MTSEQKVALDIYTFLYRSYYGKSPEEITERIKYGSNGAIDKVLLYIQDTYFNTNDKFKKVNE